MRHVIFDPPEIEYLEGRSYPKVSPKRTHSMVQGALMAILARCGKGRGASGPEWRFHLTGDTSLVPDIAFVSYERLRSLSDEDAEEPPFAPDVAAEVRSPSNRAAPIAGKIRQYLLHGSELVLDVDPARRVVHAHTKSGVRVFHAGERFACERCPWLRFDVDELFANIDIPR